MSQLWRDQIQVFFGPGQVNMVGMSRGTKSEQLFRLSSMCAQAAGAVQWEAPLNLLEQMIQREPGRSGSLRLRRGAELNITLSNQFVRYGVVAPQPTVANPDEIMAYASFQMREIYGERINDWSLSLSMWDPFNGALCAAIPLDLQSGIEAFALRHNIKLKRIEPYLAATLDHWSRELDSKRLWFVLIEPERFCLVFLQNDSWRCVRNQRVVQNLGEELLSALEQEAIILGRREPVEQVYVFAPEYSEPELTSNHGWKFVLLPGGKKPAPAHFPLSRIDGGKAEACVA